MVEQTAPLQKGDIISHDKHRAVLVLGLTDCKQWLCLTGRGQYCVVPYDASFTALGRLDAQRRCKAPGERYSRALFRVWVQGEDRGEVGVKDIRPGSNARPGPLLLVWEQLIKSAMMTAIGLYPPRRTRATRHWEDSISDRWEEV